MKVHSCRGAVCAAILRIYFLWRPHLEHTSELENTAPSLTSVLLATRPAMFVYNSFNQTKINLIRDSIFTVHAK